MSKVMQLYSMSANDALKLSDSQVSFMLEHAEAQASTVLKGNKDFESKLAPVKDAVKSTLGG